MLTAYEVHTYMENTQRKYFILSNWLTIKCIMENQTPVTLVKIILYTVLWWIIIIYLL